MTGDAYVVVYSITDRQSFQTAVQLMKNIRDNELVTNPSSLKRHVPIILVGNKSDLVRKRSVTKESSLQRISFPEREREKHIVRFLFSGSSCSIEIRL